MTSRLPRTEGVVFASKVSQWVTCRCHACPRRATPAWPTFPCSRLATSLTSASSNRPQLSVWPATRPSWSPSNSLRDGGGPGTKGLCFGKCGRTRLSGSWRKGVFVRIQNMDLVRPGALDNRRLEIVAVSLSLFLGAQLVVDTTLVSVLRRADFQHVRWVNEDGVSLAAARWRSGLSRLVLLRCEDGGRWPEEAQKFVRGLARTKLRGRVVAIWGSELVKLGAWDEQPYWRVVLSGPSHFLYSNFAEVWILTTSLLRVRKWSPGAITQISRSEWSAWFLLRVRQRRCFLQQRVQKKSRNEFYFFDICQFLMNALLCVLTHIIFVSRSL